MSVNLCKLHQNKGVWVWCEDCTYGVYSSTQEPYAPRDFGLVSSDQEQGIPSDRCTGCGREKRSGRAGVSPTLVGPDPPCRPPHRTEISVDGVGSFQFGTRRNGHGIANSERL